MPKDIQGEILTIRTDKEYTREDFAQLVCEDYFMYITLNIKVVFKVDLWLLDDIEYKIIKQFKGV